MGWKATPTWASQYGLPVCTGRPQNQKSSVAGSPTGHLQVRSVNSISESFLAFFSISLTLASAAGSISLAEGCGGSGWPAGMICLERPAGAAGAGSVSSSAAVSGAGAVSCGAGPVPCGSGAGLALGRALAAGLGLAAPLSGAAAVAPLPAPLRLDRPSRCTLPITALRVTPPSSFAIWLADWPSAHIFFSFSTRSSLQDIQPPHIKGRPVVGPPGSFFEASILITVGPVTRDRITLGARTAQAGSNRHDARDTHGNPPLRPGQLDGALHALRARGPTVHGGLDADGAGAAGHGGA